MQMLNAKTAGQTKRDRARRDKAAESLDKAGGDTIFGRYRQAGFHSLCRQTALFSTQTLGADYLTHASM